MKEKKHTKKTDELPNSEQVDTKKGFAVTSTQDGQVVKGLNDLTKALLSRRPQAAREL